MQIEAIFKVIAYGVPALMVLGGIALLLIGYPTGNSNMISGGWGLIVFGAIIYVLEILIKKYG